MQAENIHKPNGFILYKRENRLFAFPIKESSKSNIILAHYEHMPYEIIHKGHQEGFNVAFKHIMPADLPEVLKVSDKETPYFSKTSKITNLHDLLRFLNDKTHLFQGFRSALQYRHQISNDEMEIDYAGDFNSSADGVAPISGGVDIVTECIKRLEQLTGKKVLLITH